MPSLVKQNFPILGMHCASCKFAIENAVSKLDGVKTVLVNFAAEKMFVEYDPGVVSLEEIIKAVASAGCFSCRSRKTKRSGNGKGDGAFRP
jgi:copper chaperone CopZ